MSNSSSSENNRTKYYIKLWEQTDLIFLTIDDGIGGSLEVQLDPVVASQLGQNMADKARNLVAKMGDTKERHEIYSTTSEVDYNAFVHPAQLPPDPQKSRRPSKSRSLRQKLEAQVGLPRASTERLVGKSNGTTISS